MFEEYNEKSCNVFEKTYYKPIEAALRWCGLIKHEELILQTVGNSLFPPINAFPKWPCLRANTEKIYDAIQSGDLPELTLIGGSAIAEGRSGSFRIVSDAPVTEDTSVNYQVSGTATNGQDFRVLSGTVIMKAGSSSVTVLIDTINDDVVFLPSDMLVAQWPARIGKVEVDEGEFVLQGNVVLSLTEPEFTITMKVSPTDRAELVVGQGVSVDLKVGGQILPGVITELGDSATVGPGGEEQYEGTVSVAGAFDAVDGATVSIDVTLAEALQVLAVPVASVLRSADGDQVRVVNDQGTITRLNVTIGLIDGEWVEIKEGLLGDELIIVDIVSGSAAEAP